jgi:phenylpyruvate tautomerase PptA (4-oxalocrotonate tautomerase family)
MPLINVKLIEDVFTPDQKREIVERLTDATSRSKARTCAR